MLRSLLVWARFKDDQDMQRKLTAEISLANNLAQIELDLVVFRCLLSFQNDKSSEIYTVKSSHFREFLYLLKDYSSSKRQATMKQAILSFWIVTFALLDDSKRQSIHHLLIIVLEKKYLESNKDLDRYWKARLNSFRTHDEALFTICPILKKLALSIASVLLAENDSTFIETESESYESSQNLIRRTKEHDNKKRSCFDMWWCKIC